MRNRSALEEKTRFLEALVSAPSADNSQPWRIEPRAETQTLVCRYATHLGRKDIFGENGHATLLSAGAILENLRRLTRHDDAVQFSWEKDADSWHITWPEALCMEPDLAELEKITLRHTNRHPFKRKLATGLPNLLQRHDRIWAQTVTDQESIFVLADALEICSQARFNDRELHEWLFSSLRWSAVDAAEGHGLDIATLHLPPGGRLFMRTMKSWQTMRWLNRLGVHRVLAMVDTQPLRTSPCMIAICGPGDREAVIDAGLVLQHIWIELNHHGLAVHPYYALTDLVNRLHGLQLQPGWVQSVTKAEALAKEALGLESGEKVHMLLRVGVPTVAPVRSQRLPLSQFIGEH